MHHAHCPYSRRQVHPLIAFIERLAAQGTTTAQDYYGCGGWVAHGFTDAWMDTGLLGPFKWALCPTCGAWLALALWDHYLFGGGEAFLRERALPVLARAVEFFLFFLTPDAAGTLHTVPATSPENSYVVGGAPYHLTMSPALDRGVLSDLFDAYLGATQALGPGSVDGHVDLREQVLEARSRLPYQGMPLVGAGGLVREYLGDYEEPDPAHRHFSGLYHLFPGTLRLAGPGCNETLAAAFRRTLEHKLEKGGGHTSWSRAWAINLWARLGDGEAAHESLQVQLTP
jgi:alpha-L-fucosidase 2